MSANPITDQYLAMVTSAPDHGHANCAQQPCMAQVNENLWSQALLAELPDVDPAVIGQVMLHIGTRLPNLAMGLMLIGADVHMLSQNIASTLRFVGADLVTGNPGGETAKASS